MYKVWAKRKKGSTKYNDNDSDDDDDNGLITPSVHICVFSSTKKKQEKAFSVEKP